MPPESEHRLNSLLEALARQRRHEAGADFELHPATRRLLLGEVKRQFPEPTKARLPWRLFFSRLGTRTTAIVGSLAILAGGGVAAWIFWTNLPRVGDLALNDNNPPQEIKFTLRKRPIDDLDKLMAVTQADSNPPAAPAPGATKPAAGQPLAAASAGSLRALTNYESDAPDMPFATLSRRTPAARLTVQPEVSDRDRSLSDPFGGLAVGGVAGAGGGGGLKGGSFTPAWQPALATGGVVALAESLATRPAGGPTANQPVLTARTDAQLMPVLPAEPAELAMIRSATAAKRLEEAATPPTPATAPARPREAEAEADKTKAVALAKAAPPANNAPAGAVQPGPAAASGSILFFAQAQDAQGLAQRGLREAGEVTGKDKDARFAFAANGTLDARTIPVLSRFELKQDGSTITVIDADGSVYEGELVVANGRAQAPTSAAIGDATVRSSDKLNRRALSGRAGAADPLANKVAASAPSDFAFRVAGTSRTLQQEVVVVATVSSQAGEAGGQPARDEKMRLGLAPAGAVGGARSAPAPAGTPAATSDQVTTPSNYGRASPSGIRTNTLLLSGKFRLGTNAEQVIRATSRTR